MVIPNLKFFEMGGGYSGVNFGHSKSEVFQNGEGGGFLVFNSRKGLSGKFGPKFTVQPETCLCITVVSHILRMRRLTRCGSDTADGLHQEGTELLLSGGKCTYSLNS